MDHSSTSANQFFSRLRLIIRNCHRDIYGNSWADGGRVDNNDPFSRLYYLRYGSAELKMSQGLTRVIPHGLYLIPAYTTCRYRCPASMDLSFIHFSAIIPGLGPLHHFVNWPIEIHPRNRAWIEERIDILVDDREDRSYLEIDGALRQLLSLFDTAAGPSGRPSPGSTRFAPVLKHIESNLNRVITVPELAETMHLQSNYFSNMFRNQFGEPPTRYIQRRRIECAAEKLAVSDITIQELAEQLGFTDAFHLSRTFKTYMKLPPSRYRKLYHANI